MAGAEDTIFALSSGSLPAGVAVIRVSGGAARFALETVAGRLPPPRVATLRRLSAADGATLDSALVLWLPGPGSFTGEDCAEFQVHGGRAVVAALLARLAALPGCRAAERGEFSLRAYRNGRIDLTGAEGLADLIAAETEIQRRQAIGQAAGGLQRLMDGWRGALVRARALIEAELDFPDEDDVPGSVSDQVWAEVAGVAAAIERALADGHRSERLRAGVQVVLMGPPNAGKSSLLNALARRDAAIVTAEPGTTRDLVEVHLDLGGYPVTLVDTAGLREADGAVEREGMRRALLRGRAADLVLWLQAVDQPATPVPAEVAASAGAVWSVATKIDLAAGAAPGATASGAGAAIETGAAEAAGATAMDEGLLPRSAASDAITISTVSESGLEALLGRLVDFAADMCGRAEAPAITRERHRHGLEACRSHLMAALADPLRPIELRAEDLRAATDALGRITGRVDVEDLLDVVFGEFCIGK